MKLDSSPLVRQCSWQDVRQDVLKVQPELTAMIDGLCPSPDLPLVQVDYPYGELIFHNGKVTLPNRKKKFVPIDDDSIDASVKQLLDYSTVPMALILAKSAEVYVEALNRVIPIAFFKQGDLIGLWETLDRASSNYLEQMWNVSSGARSAFMVPKITDTTSHNRLRRSFDMHRYVPQSLIEHWHIFKDIAAKLETKQPWYCRILFFTKPWYQLAHEKKPWLDFNLFLYREAWNQSKHWRNRMYFDLIWESKVLEIFNQNIKYQPYIIRTAKHLLYIAMGGFPGFVASGLEQLSGPFDKISDSYSEIYGLKNYCPIIMRPQHLRESDEHRFVYYSLQFPTLLEYTRLRKKPSTAMADLRDTKQLLDLLQNAAQSDERILSDLVQQTRFDFYHSDVDPYREIEQTQTLLDADPIMQSLKQHYQDKPLSDSGPFFRGCIKISV